MRKYTPPDAHNIVFSLDDEEYIGPDSHNIVFHFNSDAYIPPDAHNIVFNFSGEAYTPPDAHNIVFNFGDTKGQVPQYLAAVGIAEPAIAAPWVKGEAETVKPDSFITQAFGATYLKNRNYYVVPGGINPGLSGINHVVKNFHTDVKPGGISSQLFGRPDIQNLRRYVTLTGYNASLYGTAFMRGGVKTVTLSGINSLAISSPTVINTRANRELKPEAIKPIDLPKPNVSPRIIYTQGLVQTLFGQAWVQRNPNPPGFIATLFGTSWISRSPREITPSKIDAFSPGYPKIFDPTQKVWLEGKPPIPAGIFGDIEIRNKQRLISVKGADQSGYGDWSNIYSNLSTVENSGFDAKLFGENTVRNKTPSIIPYAFNSATFGLGLIAYRHRSIRVSGFVNTTVNKPIVDKTPQLSPRGIGAFASGHHAITNGIRYIEAGALNATLFGIQIRIWFRYRYLAAPGIASLSIPSPKVERGVRELIIPGFAAPPLAQPTVWFKLRQIAPPSIHNIFASNHQVGGTQHVQPIGYVASLFGERIVPEIQSVYPLTWFSQGFGQQQIELYKRWVRVPGFTTHNQMAGERFGHANFWNKRQYIIQQYDSGNGLNPPPFGQWTAIANRNRTIKVSSFDAARYGYVNILNKATPIKPAAMDQLRFGMSMIAYRVRQLRLQGMEAPYISSWGRVVNAAAQLMVPGRVQTLWGVPGVVNTRREYRWVGAFESMLFGQPMVDFKIRTLSIEGRHSINPIYPPMPKVELSKRYVEPIWPEHNKLGNPSLYIRWNRITPRWTLREYFGEHVVKNLTPELLQRGVNSEIFGVAALRNQWRHLPIDGFGAQLFGKPDIAYRDRSIAISGFAAFGYGLQKVTKTGAPPYSLQHITLDWIGEGERPLDFEGDGIELPFLQVSSPSLRTNVIYPRGFVATAFTSPHTQSNGILVQPGIQEFAVGNHTVILRNRVISVPTLGDLLQIKETRPRLSPHTIYAVVEAPEQAKNNHPTSASLHYVNSNRQTGRVGEEFGIPKVALFNRRANAQGFALFKMGDHTIQLSKRYISVRAINSYRSGWHLTSDGSPRTITQYDSKDMSLFGKPDLKKVHFGPFIVQPQGFVSTVFGPSKTEFLHRPIYPRAWVATEIGYSRGNDTPYKPQSLWVGKPHPTIPNGFLAEKFGTTAIGLRVRDIGVPGFESFSSELDIAQFGGRIKVIQEKKPIIITPKEVNAPSMGLASYGVPDIRLKVHYIRPDGNSNQYRKGGLT